MNMEIRTVEGLNTKYQRMLQGDKVSFSRVDEEQVNGVLIRHFHLTGVDGVNSFVWRGGQLVAGRFRRDYEFPGYTPTGEVEWYFKGGDGVPLYIHYKTKGIRSGYYPLAIY